MKRAAGGPRYGPAQPWILVTSEFRARQPEPAHVEMPGRVDRFVRDFPHVVAVRAYGSTRATATSAPGYLTLPVHSHPAWVPVDFAVTLWRLRRYGRSAAAVWIMWPGVLASASSLALAFTGIPVVLNVVGDPYEATRKQANHHPLRAPARLVHRLSGRLLARRARVIRYVNANSLPRICPPGPRSAVFVLSDVDVSAVAEPRDLPQRRPLRIVTVGSLEQPYKGVDTLIQATRVLQERGFSVTLTVVGGGRLEATYQALADQVLGDSARFTGSLPSSVEVAAEVGSHDVFALASLTEGMPRAMIEAMALGLPCAGTRVGGIPDLVPDRFLAPAGEPLLLADAMEALIADPDTYRAASEHSIALARTFTRDSTGEVRLDFCRAVQACGPQPRSVEAT